MLKILDIDSETLNSQKYVMIEENKFIYETLIYNSNATCRWTSLIKFEIHIL